MGHTRLSIRPHRCPHRCTACQRPLSSTARIASHNLACADRGEREYVVDGRRVTNALPKRLVEVQALPIITAAKHYHRSGDRRVRDPFARTITLTGTFTPTRRVGA